MILLYNSDVCAFLGAFHISFLYFFWALLYRFQLCWFISALYLLKISPSSSQELQNQGPIQRLSKCFTDLRGQLSSQSEITACLNQWIRSHNPASYFMFISSTLNSLSFRSRLKKPQLVPLGFQIRPNCTEHSKVNRIYLCFDMEGSEEISNL